MHQDAKLLQRARTLGFIAAALGFEAKVADDPMRRRGAAFAKAAGERVGDADDEIALAGFAAVAEATRSQIAGGIDQLQNCEIATAVRSENVRVAAFFAWEANVNFGRVLDNVKVREDEPGSIDDDAASVRFRDRRGIGQIESSNGGALQFIPKRGRSECAEFAGRRRKRRAEFAVTLAPGNENAGNGRLILGDCSTNGFLKDLQAPWNRRTIREPSPTQSTKVREKSLMDADLYPRIKRSRQWDPGAEIAPLVTEYEQSMNVLPDAAQGFHALALICDYTGTIEQPQKKRIVKNGRDNVRG